MADTFRELYLAMADELDHSRQCLMDDRSLTHPLADCARAALAAAPAPVGGPSDEVVEDAAQVIYGSMRFDRIDSTSDWIPNGNSLAQDEARRCARAVLARYGITPAPASNGEVGELAAALRTEAEAYAKLDTYRKWAAKLTRAADLLEHFRGPTEMVGTAPLPGADGEALSARPPLSPAAQAVRSAAIEAWGDPRSTVDGVAAAALRAAADAVVPATPLPRRHANPQLEWAVKNEVRQALLAIADELEAGR